MKNWKTTLTGVIGAVALALEKVISTGTMDERTLIMCAIVAALGFIGKDFNVTGNGTETK